MGGSDGSGRGTAHLQHAAEGGGRSLPEAGFALEARGDARWMVESFEAREALSAVSALELTAVSESAGADPDALLGHDAALVVSRAGAARRHPGIVSRVEHLGLVDGKVRARLTVVPALWALSQRVDSRVYEARTVREVVDDVLRRALAPYQRAWRWELQRALTPREHTVQYQETDLAFIERLLSEEGISYGIVPGERAEEVLFFDAAQSLPRYAGAREDALEVSDEEHATRARESLRRFEPTRALTPTRATVRDYDWTRPDATVEAERAVGDDPAGRAHRDAAHRPRAPARRPRARLRGGAQIHRGGARLLRVSRDAMRAGARRGGPP